MRTSTIGACGVVMNSISVFWARERFKRVPVCVFLSMSLDSTLKMKHSSALQYTDVEAAAFMEKLEPATTGVLSV